MNHAGSDHLGCRRTAAMAAAVILAWGALGSEGRAAALSVDECVELARKNSPVLASARYGVAGASASRLSATSAFLPSVNVSAGFRQTASRPGDPIYALDLGDSSRPWSLRVLGYDQVNPGYSSEYSVTQNLLNLPGVYRYRASVSDLASARENFRAGEADLAYGVRQQYFLLLKAILLEKVASEALAVANEQLRKSEALFELGSVARADVLQARVNRAAADRERIAARNAIEQERASLAVLMGMDAREPLEIVQDVADPPEIVSDEDGLTREALEYRPEVRQAEARLQAAKHRHRSAVWSQLPVIGAGLSYSKGADRLGDLTDPGGIKDDGAQWGYSIGLSWNLFDGLETIGGIAAAKADLAAAREERRLRRLEASLAVREAQVAIRNGNEGVLAAIESVALAEENLKLQQALYENGGGTILEVNNAQAELTRAKTDLVNARIALHVALALQARALGR